jgi:hypothetical protein
MQFGLGQEIDVVATDAIRPLPRFPEVDQKVRKEGWCGIDPLFRLLSFLQGWLETGR